MLSSHVIAAVSSDGFPLWLNLLKHQHPGSLEPSAKQEVLEIIFNSLLFCCFFSPSFNFLIFFLSLMLSSFEIFKQRCLWGVFKLITEEWCQTGSCMPLQCHEMSNINYSTQTIRQLSYFYLLFKAIIRFANKSRERYVKFALLLNDETLFQMWFETLKLFSF